MSDQNKNNSSPEQIPCQIGKFKITGKLGRGGMGDIYKAVQEPLGRVVALKVLPPQFSRDTEFTRRFEIEAKAISQLQHQNIVSIYEYGEEGDFRYFAMQYVDGQNLGQRMDHVKQLAIDEIIDIAKQVCRGLRYAHSKGIIHRDIKPQNILIDESGVVRITDFGIARIFAQSSITMTGVTVGTPEYMSPEQAEGADIDAQSDLYSLGILMYEMLTKKPPFTGNNPVAIAYKQVHELPPPPCQKRHDIPRRLELIVLKALKKDKQERYRNVEEMLEHLDSVDLCEDASGRPTAPLAALKGDDRKMRAAMMDKRITDRRSGDRRYKRHSYLTHDGTPIAGWNYVVYRFCEMVKNQTLSLVLIAILAVILITHILSKPSVLHLFK